MAVIYDPPKKTPSKRKRSAEPVHFHNEFTFNQELNMHEHRLFHRLSCAHVCQLSWHSRHATPMPSIQGFHGWKTAQSSPAQDARNTTRSPFTLGFGRHSSTTALFIIMDRQRERGRGEETCRPKLQWIWFLVSGKNNLTEQLWEVRHKLDLSCLSGASHCQHQAERIPTAFISLLLYWLFPW